MKSNRRNIRLRHKETGKAGPILTVALAIFIALLFSFLTASCSKEKGGVGGSPDTPETGRESIIGGGKDDLDSTDPEGSEAPDLGLTAKTMVTYLVDGTVDEVEEGFIAFSGPKTRYETPRGRGFPYTLVTINRGDLRLNYVLVPERNRYFEFRGEVDGEESKGVPGDNLSAGKTPLGYGSVFGGTFESSLNSENEVSRTFLGMEEVSGYSCKKFKVKEKFLDGTFTHYTEWLAVDLNHLPIKTEYRLETGDRLYITRWKLTEIKRGAPSPDLFTIPGGYIKVNNLSEALKEDTP